MTTSQQSSSRIAALSNALQDGKTHLLLAATGSVAAIKLSSIINALASYSNLSIRIILTKSAVQFFTGAASDQPTVEALAGLPNVDGVYCNEDEWAEPWTRGAGILHIELRRWAHLLVVAPLCANTLAKLANGLCDDLLTSVVRAWDSDRKARIVLAPAMNSLMWTHPVTARHLKIIEEDTGVKTRGDDGWTEVLSPEVKVLACGDHGHGGMSDWRRITGVIEDRLKLGQDTQVCGLNKFQ